MTPIHFHENLLFFGRKDRSCVCCCKSKHEEDEQEPVHAKGLEAPAADPLRPQPGNTPSLRCYSKCVNPLGRGQGGADSEAEGQWFESTRARWFPAQGLRV